MKDLRFVLSIFLLILIVLLLNGCNGVVPSPGATDEDVTTISGQILMPTICCLPLPEEEAMSKDNGACNETEFWAELPNARVELVSAKNCNSTPDETFADGSGYYEFEDVKPGLYIITAYCTEDESFVVKDVAVKVEGEALNAGIPDCTSTGIALVMEKINGCYNDFYQCFGKYTVIYKKVEAIAGAIGEVNVQDILSQYQSIEGIDTLATAAGITDVQPILNDFGDVCDDDLYGLVDMICEWNCCLAPGTTGGGNGDEEEDITYDLTMLVSPEGGGTTTPSVGGSPHTYNEGTVVDISAIAADGYDFVNWTGDVADPNSSSTTVTMDADKTVTANFVDPCADNSAPYNIDLDNKCAVVGQPYTGTVTADDDDEDTLTFAFKDGYTPPGDMAIDSVTGVITWTPTEDDICVCGQLASAARERAEFIGLCDPIQVTVSDPCESIDAEFCVSVQPAQYTLTMKVSPEGSGTTTPSVGGSPHIYSAGTVVNINASASTGYQFVGWTGDAVADAGSTSTTITMDSNKIVTANFVADIFLGGTASIAFEDLEIDEESDYDYNDWIVDLTINTVYDGDTPNMSSITFAILPKARGAGHDHRFHILISQDTFDEDGAYELVINGTGGSDSGTFNSSADMDFIVIPDTRESLGGETHNHTNTKEGVGPTPASVTATLTITFDTPFYYDFSQYDPYSADSMHGEGLFFDPYLEVDTGNNNQFDSANYEIHKEDPRILTVPDSWEWPEEGISIWNVYESSVSVGNPPVFSPAWWTVSPNNCVYGDGITCP